MVMMTSVLQISQPLLSLEPLGQSKPTIRREKRESKKNRARILVGTKGCYGW